MKKKYDNSKIWAKNHRINDDGVVERQCSNCKEWKEENSENFYLHNKSKPEKGFVGLCKICSRLKTQNWQKDNPEKYYEGIDRRNKNPSPTRLKTLRARARKQMLRGDFKKWRKENPEKCRAYSKKHRNHDITKTEEEAMLKVFNYSCAYCGMTLEEHKNKYREKLHNDHVDDEGYNDLRNDVPACKGCNCGKHTEDMETWYKQQSFFSEENLNKIIWWIHDGYKKYIENKPPYRITRHRIYNSDNSYYLVHDLWTVDEKRNLVEMIYSADKRKDILEFVKNNNII